MPLKRSRPIYLLLIILTIAVGLFSRSRFIPELIYPYIGDYFFTIMYFFIVAFLFPNMKSIKVAIISILICYVTEVLQLYHADWITEIRNTRMGSLILGHGFLWSDIAMYTLGGLTGYIMEIKYNNIKS